MLLKPTGNLRARRALSLIVAVLAAVLLGSCGGSGDSGSTTMPLSITTTALPGAAVGTAYSATLAASGGTGPYSWMLSGGTLPPGLSFDAATATVSGTPVDGASTSSLTFQVSDASSPVQTVSTMLTLKVAAGPLAVTTHALPNGQVNSPYEATLTAAGGTAPYSWALTSGTLPAGLSLDASTGELTGSPTAAVSSAPLTFQVTDSASPAAKVSASLTLTVVSGGLTITTTQLPYGQVGQAYSAQLAAAGGSGALTWALTAGTLPAGLTLDAASGLISGTPTATATQAPLTVSVTDSGSPPQNRNASFPITVSPAGISVQTTPVRAGLTLGQTLSLTATTNDNAGVTWSVSPGGGSFSAASSLTGVPVIFTAPTTAGVYTLTATSQTDTTRTANVTVGVTDLGGVYTYHHDAARDGANVQEYALTPANVTTATFGKLFSCPVDGAVYAQPLWVANLSIAGVPHNVVFVATEHDSLYAFDADASPCLQLWHVNLIDSTHGGTSGETTVPSGATGNLVGVGYGDISPETGVTGTPVIDPSASILYVVSKSVSGTTTFYQRLHAIDLASGAERAGSPITIAASYTADNGSAVAFSSQQQLQRSGLALSNGVVYVAWGAHEDSAPWYGWVMGYTYSGGTFTQHSVLNVSPNTGEAGVWMAGGAPSVDSNGHLYVITGNGNFDGAATGGSTDDYGDSFLQLAPNAGQNHLGVSSFFTPSDQASDDSGDHDFGSGGSALVLNLASNPGSGVPQHLVVGGGKDGSLYVLNGDQMGGSGDSNAYQMFGLGTAIFATAAFWNNSLYIGPIKAGLQAYAFNGSRFTTTPSSTASANLGFPGATPSVSASGASSNGIVWAIDAHNYCTPQSGGCGPAVLHAWGATNLGTELWNSSLISADSAGNAVKFTVPTVANGKVYVGTRGNNTGGAYGSTSVSGELEIYGLKPN